MGSVQGYESMVRQEEGEVQNFKVRMVKWGLDNGMSVGTMLRAVYLSEKGDTSFSVLAAWWMSCKMEETESSFFATDFLVWNGLDRGWARWLRMEEGRVLEREKFAISRLSFYHELFYYLGEEESGAGWPIAVSLKRGASSYPASEWAEEIRNMKEGRGGKRNLVHSLLEEVPLPLLERLTGAMPNLFLPPPPLFPPTPSPLTESSGKRKSLRSVKRSSSMMNT